MTISAESRVSAGFRFLALFEVALIIATRPLWWGNNEFPQVPLLPVFPGAWLSRMFAGLLVLAACLIAVTRGPASGRSGFMRPATWGAFIAGLVLVMLNQHRLQAWHWLFLLNTSWMLIIPRSERLMLMRHTICTVYVCSALSRISDDPLSGMSAAVVYKSLAIVGVTGLTPDSQVPIVLCHVTTLGELLVGVLLLERRTRLGGCIGALLLHLSLLMILGPLGLNHHAGVLLWNLCFLALIPTLFWGKDLAFCGDQPRNVSPRFSPLEPGANALRLNRSTPLSNRPAVTRAAIAMAWLFPLSGLFGFADNWPSWQLYSTRPESWLLSVHDEDRNRVQGSIAETVGDPVPLSKWCPVKLDRWSLEQTGSPICPQGRFQLATATWFLAQVPDDVRFQIEVSEPCSLFWWKRQHRVISSRDELHREHDRFILNSTAVP